MVFDSQLGEREGHIALYVEPLIYIYPFHRALETISSLYRALSFSPVSGASDIALARRDTGLKTIYRTPIQAEMGQQATNTLDFFPFRIEINFLIPFQHNKDVSNRIILTGPVCFCNPDRIVYGCDSDLTLEAIDIFRPALRSASLVKLLLFFSA